MIEKSKNRIENIDILRGIVIILMAFDHARDYTGIMPTDPMTFGETPFIVYLLRNMTHFCAPIFILLSGISAKIANLSSKYLFQRGVVLLLLECTFVNLGWSFNPLYKVTYLQVIWAIGMSMIILSVAKHLNKYLLLILSVLIIAFHNLVSTYRFDDGSLMHYIWSFLLQRNMLPTFGSHMVRTTYPILPVFAIMGVGYFIGEYYKEFTVQIRKRYLYSISGGMLLLFGISRIIFKYGDSSVIDNNNFVWTLFNMTKYPMSFNFILFYLGFGILFLAITDGKIYSSKNILKTFGNVPMFFYILHLYILHIIILIYALIKHEPLNFSKYLGGVPYDFGYPLWALLIVVPMLLLISYYPCKYYLKLKKKKYWFTKYI